MIIVVVTFHITFKLFLPEFTIMFRQRRITVRTSVPETTVYKNGYLAPRIAYVRLTRNFPLESVSWIS